MCVSIWGGGAKWLSFSLYRNQISDSNYLRLKGYLTAGLCSFCHLYYKYILKQKFLDFNQWSFLNLFFYVSQLEVVGPGGSPYHY